MPHRSASHRRSPILLSLILPILLSACQPQPQPPSGPQAADPAEPALLWPRYDYAAAERSGQDVFTLGPQATQIDIVVRRDGPLARFGHDHVVTVQDPQGFLLLDDPAQDSRADLRFRLDQLAVDSAAARARRELDTHPDAADIEGTRVNLMEHVVDADQWPWVVLELTDFSQQEDHFSAMLAVAINGAQFSGRQPFRLRRDGDRALVDGFLVLLQTELGMEPFSALGGGLRVADPLEIHVHLEATRQ